MASMETAEAYERVSCRKRTSRLLGARVSLRKEMRAADTVLVWTFLRRSGKMRSEAGREGWMDGADLPLRGDVVGVREACARSEMGNRVGG